MVWVHKSWQTNTYTPVQIGFLLVLDNVQLRHAGNYHCIRKKDLNCAWNSNNSVTLVVLGEHYAKL